MIEIVRIIYVYKNYKEVERPNNLTFDDKKQMEIYRKNLLKIKNTKAIFFSYEEH